MKVLLLARWLTLHAADVAAALAALTVILRAAYAVVSAVVRPFPRLRAVVEAVAAASPDVLRGAVQLLRAVTGRDIPDVVTDARDERIARLERELGAARHTLAAHAARQIEARPTLAPPAPADPSP